MAKRAAAAVVWGLSASTSEGYCAVGVQVSEEENVVGREDESQGHECVDCPIFDGRQVG